MTDLRAGDAELGAYVQSRYPHLSPPASPGMRLRMGLITAEQAALEEAASGGRAEQAWLDTPPDRLSPVEAADRARGAMLGLAIGDAVGTTLEFTPRDAARVDDMVGGDPFDLRPGEWTDDTSMALCLADALIADCAFRPASFARQLVRWYRHGHNGVNGRCFDIGLATRTALEGHEADPGRWRGNTDARTAGNGSLVRSAPLAIATRGSLQATWRLSAAQSVVTHGAPEAVACCQLFGMILHHSLRGAGRDEALAPKVASLPPRPQIINAGEYRAKPREAIRSSGYVVDTLEAALWAVAATDDFEGAVLLAANLADDADSVAAAAGQLAGALYGAAAIPPRWVERVAWRDSIAARADALLALGLGV